MSKEIYISSTPHETRLAIVENDALTEIYYERENEYTLAGSIYNGKVTRVLPGMQSSFVDIGLDRDAFLYITDFMEEAGDTADFEASAASGEAKRTPRDGGRGERGGRDRNSDRGGDRNGQPRTIEGSAEPTDAELFTQAVSGVEPIRPTGDGERERSGGRRGGRNRRDRHAVRSMQAEGTPRRESERPAFVEPILAAPTPAESGDRDETIGEGAPGADGSRRWRGRRGRRGNRGQGAGQDRVAGQDRTQGQRSAQEPLADEQSVQARPDTGLPVAEVPRRAETGPLYDAYGRDEAAVVDAPAEQSGFSARGDRGDRGRRDRDRGPRAPRGFAPAQERYGVVEENLNEPAVEPLILPGESLSKYRPQDSSQAGAAAATPVAPVVSEFVAQGWDGGLVLPGETIRPRGASAGGDTQRRDFRSESRDRGDRRRDDRGPRPDRNQDRGARSERSWQAAPVVEPIPAPEEAHETQVFETELVEQPTHQEHAPETVAEQNAVPSEAEPQLATPQITPLHTTFVPPPPIPGAEAEAEAGLEPPHEEFQETVHEFEPSEGSASFRVDPVPPSEFRQSAVYDEETFADEPVSQAPVESLEAEPVHETVHTPEEPGAPVQSLESTHDVTLIYATGDMVEEPASLVTQDLVATSPSAQGPEHSMTPVPADAAASDQTIPAATGWFAPGTGILEEEVLDEEDEPATLPTIFGGVQARGEHEPQEQETLENAADLGTMLREMNIDHMTRTEAAVDEEDEDLEEDFLEEDQDYEHEEHEGEDEHAQTEDHEHEESDGPEYSLEETDEAAEGGAATAAEPTAAAGGGREPRRDGRRDDRGRRDGRRGDRNRRSSERERGAAPAGDRAGSDHGRHDGRGRQSMQTTNLPAISDLLKPGQEILCQIAKEPIAKKGARITSHIALPGRFLVFMPTVNHIGVSRKIESDGERRRLKEVLLSEKGDASGGFIVRTAASGASEEELRSDLRFLLNLWADIKTRSESSKSPALIYHDLNLVERVLRDQVTDNFSAIWVDTESQYEQVLRFLQRFQPSLIRRVKLYTKEMPLFEQFGITEEINKALRSKVWLKSGGSIVINQTEALVAIDINTGKFVGKTARLEDTIVKTNLDAIPEIVRQIRLRDLGGIIIIDFIDMDERKNRNKVMAALEEELKSDRAPSKVLQFNDFGLVAITRKRVKQSLERTLSITCGVCQGTGMVKSPVTVCNDIYIEMRKMHKHLDRGDVMLRVHPDVVKQLKSTTSRWLQEMEEMVGKTILVKSDPSLHPEQFDLH